jgi:hypothetical protein
MVVAKIEVGRLLRPLSKDRADAADPQLEEHRSKD